MIKARIGRNNSSPARAGRDRAKRKRDEGFPTKRSPVIGRKRGSGRRFIYDHDSQPFRKRGIEGKKSQKKGKGKVANYSHNGKLPLM